MAHALLTEEIAKNDIKNANEFRKNLEQFTGTFTYHKLSFLPIYATDGVTYFCENANSVKLKNPAKVITLKEIPAELKDTPIPTGEYMTKQCFWFNKKYMKQQIKDFIKSY